MKQLRQRWEKRLGRRNVLVLMAVLVTTIGYLWPREEPVAPTPQIRPRRPAVPVRRRAASRPAPRPRLTLAQRQKRKQALRDELFSGEFAFSSFPRKYQDLIRYKIKEFQIDCELGKRCVKEELVMALKRAGPMLKQVRQMLRKADVPPILLYLNFAESLWKDDIRSHAGAYGVCQFMPSTAKWLGFLLHGEFRYYRDCSQRVLMENDKGNKYFGLQKKIEVYSKVYLYDQRRDVFTAIAKKIEYLKALKSRYFGDSWILAAFRYNFGPGNVAKIMRSVRRRFARLPRRRRTYSRLIWMFLRSNRSQENYHYVANIMAFAHILSGLEVDHPEWVKPEVLEAVAFRAPVETRIVLMRRGETISKIASRHRVTVRAVLKATGISVAQAGRLPIGARIKVPTPKSLFLTPLMVRKKLGVGMVFYDWNPGIHDPRTKIKRVDYKYAFLYKAGADESFASIAKKFKHRRVRLRRLLRDNLSALLQRKARQKRGKIKVKAGTILLVRGRMTLGHRKGTNVVATPTQRRQIERTMPPLPGGWVLYVPRRLAGTLRAFLKAKVKGYTAAATP